MPEIELESLVWLVWGGSLVGFPINVENTFFVLLVYNLHHIFSDNLHLQQNMEIYNLHIKNMKIYNS